MLDFADFVCYNTFCEVTTMKLQYLGHASFRIISEMGTTVVCDPYKADWVGFDMARVRCDVVTISHHHADHDCMDSILGSPAELDVEISCAADDIAIESIATFHDDEQGAKRGANLVFTFLVDGLKVVHMGDIGCLDDKVVSQIRGCDVLLLPVGGTFTVDYTGAKWYVDQVAPKIVVPMHYQTDEHNFTVDGVDKFLSLFPAESITANATDTLTLYDAPQNDQTQVVVLQRYKD